MLRICRPNRKPEWKEWWTPDAVVRALKATGRGFPGGPWAEMWPLWCRGRGFNPWSGPIPK